MPRAVLLALSLMCGSASLRAQERAAVVLSGESRAAAGRIDDIRQRLAAKKWDSAVAEIQSVLETTGDELAPLGPDRAVQARIVCQQLLATLPADVRPEVLRLYRGRAEAQARKWLEQGLAERDVQLLRRVVQEAFCTRAAERALDALGDLAFERGRFDEAEQWWRTLTPPTKADSAPGDLVYPDPETDAARTRAKQLLARLFRSEPRWEDDLAAYRKLHPDAAGKLAGREGRYADVLKTVAAELRRPDASERAWPTFGGDPGRGPLLPATTRQTDRLGALCRRPTWRFSLEKRERIDGPTPPPQLDGVERKSAQFLAFHPVLVDDKLIVADARTVTAFDVRTGRGETWFDATRTLAGLNLNLALPAPPDLRYTLTVADDCVLARLGTQEMRDARAAKKDGESASLLACLDFEPAPNGQRLRWVVRAATRDADIFEGAPLVQDGRVFVAATRCLDGKTITAVHCYALEARGTPPLRWSRDVCETNELQNKDHRLRHHLLTLAGPNLVYCSHSGAVVALDALTGRRAWAVRYPVLAPIVGSELPGIDRPPQRDLTPCLSAAGRLYVAPSDSDRLLCLDPLTGRTLWERKIVDVLHLLGVARGRLIVTTAGTLRAVDAATGADAWTAPDAGELPSMGRGLLLGDLVLWPTTRGVLVIRQEDGRPAEDPAFLHAVPKGNLAFGHGSLIVADRMTLTLFAPLAKHLQERRNDAEREPESADVALELGFAEADAGLFDAAVKRLERAERLAKREPALREEARAARHAVFMTAARSAADSGRREETERALGQAAGAEYSPAERVNAQRSLAEQRERFGDHAGAVAAWQALIEDHVVRGVRVKGNNDLPRTAGQLATERIAALLKKPGNTSYLAIEKRAKARFDAAATTKDRAAALERLTMEFPHAAVRRVALRELDGLYWESGRCAGVAHVCDRLRADPGSEDDVIELRRRWSNMLDNLLGLPTLPIQLPLFRQGRIMLECSEAVPVGADAIGVPARGPLYTSLPRSMPSLGGWLRCHDESGSDPCWQTPLPFVPGWVSSFFHLILVGGPHGLAAIRLDDGYPVWSFPAESSQFQASSGRIFFLEDGRLFALDVRSGMVVWQREAPGAGFLPKIGRFYSEYFAGADRVLIQTASGRRWLLDAETGRTLHDAPTSSEPWPIAPQGLPDNRLLLVVDRRIVVLDAHTGDEVWSTTVRAPSAISSESPRVLVRGKTILVLTQTNLGSRLQRLDDSTGKPLWPTMPLLAPDTPETSDWGLDNDCFYLAQDRKLIALSLADGKPRWETSQAGPAGTWRAQRESDFLLVYPTKVSEWRFQFRSPIVAVQWGIGLPPEERPGSGCPLLALDPATGRILQRWNFPAGPLSLRSYPAEPSMWPVLNCERVLGDAGMTVISTGSGLVVTVGGRAWGLRSRD